MISLVRLSGAALAACLLSVVPAHAQALACVDPASRQIDPQASQTLQAMMEHSDPELMGRIAGVWYVESHNPNGQVDYQYQQYSADGFFDYKDRVCSANGACNDYAGQGSYAVIGLPDGTIEFMTVVSDLNRDRQCSGSVARFVDADSLQFAAGGVLRRVQ